MPGSRDVDELRNSSLGGGGCPEPHHHDDAVVGAAAAQVIADHFDRSIDLTPRFSSVEHDCEVVAARPRPAMERELLEEARLELTAQTHFLGVSVPVMITSAEFPPRRTINGPSSTNGGAGGSPGAPVTLGPSGGQPRKRPAGNSCRRATLRVRGSDIQAEARSLFLMVTERFEAPPAFGVGDAKRSR